MISSDEHESDFSASPAADPSESVRASDAIGARADELLADELVPLACPCEFGEKDRYRLEEMIGLGRRSYVYRARDLTLSGDEFNAMVAVKIIRPRGNTPADTAEALSGRRVTNENVTRVLDRGIDPTGLPYLVTEYVDGGDLSSRIRVWPVREAVAFMVRVARGVQAVHSAGVVHCDLKPANILVTAGGRPKIADFDLSRSADRPDESSRGNAAYMAPEQYFRWENSLAPPADIYALGGILFSLLTGRLPHGATQVDIDDFHRAGGSPPSPMVEADLDAICRRAMEREIKDRYVSAAAFADDLELWLAHRPLGWRCPTVKRRAALWARRRPGHAMAVVASVVLAIGAGAGSWYLRDRERALNAEAERVSARNIKQFKERGAALIRPMILSLARAPAADADEGALASLMWVQWITDHPVLGTSGMVPNAVEQSTILGAIVKSAEAAGTPDHVDVLLARFAMSIMLLKAGSVELAAPHLAALERSPFARLDPEDPVAVSIRACRAASDVLVAKRAGIDLAPALEALDRCEREVRANTRCKPAKRLIEEVNRMVRPREDAGVRPVDHAKGRSGE